MVRDRDGEIATGRQVTLRYSLRDQDGRLLDSSEQSGPLIYQHGCEDMLPALERALEGRRAGERLRVELAPEDAYGARAATSAQVLPRSAFPASVVLEEGLPIAKQEANGQLSALFVTRVEDERVTLDNNHPLAGRTLYFDIEICAVSE